MIEKMGENYSFNKLNRIIQRKKVTLTDFELTLIPVNIENSHWLVLALDFRNKVLFVIDSLGGSGTAASLYLRTMLPFITDYEAFLGIQ